MNLLTKESESFWSAPKSLEWLYQYKDSTTREDRDHLLKELAKFEWKSILEVGCNCAPIFKRLRTKDIRYAGLDINGRALEFAKFMYPEAKFYLGSAFEELPKFITNSFDVVLSSSFLSAIAPDDILEILNEMTRIAKKCIVIQEPAYESHNGEFHWWHHDYQNLLITPKDIEIIIL